MKDKLLQIVGGGQNQVAIVNLAKSLGLKVLVTDMYENPPCRALADYFEQADTTDREGNLEIAKKYKIDAIVTDQTDVAVPTVAYVAESLGLKGIGFENALRFTNKYTMREYLKHQLPSVIPDFHFFDEPREAIAFYNSHADSGKWIVKPINSQGSKGVYILTVQSAVDRITTAWHESRSRGILIEQFVEGYEFSVEAYVQDNRVYNLAITKKYHYISNDCIDVRNTYLGDISPELENRLFQVNAQVIQSLKLPFGVTHAEYKVDGDKVCLMEIAARGGGGSISSKIIPYLTGFEPNRALIHCVFNEPFDIKIDDYKLKFVVMKFFEFKPGKTTNIYFDNNLASDLLVFQLDIRPGDEIREVKDSRDRPGYFVVAGTDRDLVLRKEKEIENAFIIEYGK
ncbi:MAG: ATP-grasp domain-containing protein [Bacteroidetes bacterium]|nr:ATP-grasp domain-containing protein [Bacteroidota bacterium]